MDKEKLKEQLQQVREDAKKSHPNLPFTGESVIVDFAKADREKRGATANQQRRWDKLLKEEREDPALKELFDGKKPENLLKRLTPKSKEEIIATGTAEEVAYLLSISTTCALDKIIGFVKVNESRAIEERLSDIEKHQVNSIFAQFYALKLYETSFKEAFLNFQKDSAFLARFITELRDDETIAHLLTSLNLNGQSTTKEDIELENNVFLVYNKRKKAYEVKIGDSDEETLSRCIDKRGIYLQRSMRSVKAKILAIEKYVEEKKLPVGAIPYVTAVCIDDIKDEVFWGDLLLDKKYFRSHLNKRIAKGAHFSIEDIETAVFPDYYELKPSDTEVKNNLIFLGYTEEKTLVYNNIFRI